MPKSNYKGLLRDTYGDTLGLQIMSPSLPSIGVVQSKTMNIYHESHPVMKPQNFTLEPNKTSLTPNLIHL